MMVRGQLAQIDQRLKLQRHEQSVKPAGVLGTSQVRRKSAGQRNATVISCATWNDISCVGCEQVDADAFAAVCLEPYSRGRVLAAYSSPPSQDADAEAAATGGIDTIDLGTKKVVSKVCLGTSLSPSRHAECRLCRHVQIISSQEQHLLGTSQGCYVWSIMARRASSLAGEKRQFLQG